MDDDAEPTLGNKSSLCPDELPSDASTQSSSVAHSATSPRNGPPRIPLNPFELLHTQLCENTKNIGDLVQTRRQILAKLVRIHSLEEKRKRAMSHDDDDNEDATAVENESREEPPEAASPSDSTVSLIGHSLDLLDYVSKMLLVSASTHEARPTKERIEQMKTEQFLLESVTRLEGCLSAMSGKAGAYDRNEDDLPHLQMSAKSRPAPMVAKSILNQQQQQQQRQTWVLEKFSLFSK